MLLFLDVDGPLIPFGAADRAHPLYDGPPVPAGHPLLPRVDPALGPRLTALGCELVWATTWGGRRQRLPRAVAGPAAAAGWCGGRTRTSGRAPCTREDPAAGPLGGGPALRLGGRRDHRGRPRLAAVHHPAPALPYRVDHRYGLTEADFAVLEEWLEAH
ncbi:hypothetical protein SCANM63S_03219 [Streptomyces canarius]